MTDADKLRKLADWFDAEQKNGRWKDSEFPEEANDVQNDLRRMAKQAEYPKIGVTVDCVLFNIEEDEAYVLLIQRGPDSKAFPNAWAPRWVSKSRREVGYGIC